MVKAKKASSKGEEEVNKISMFDNDSERSIPAKQNKKSTEEYVLGEQVSSKRVKEKRKAKITDVSLFEDAEPKKIFKSK